MKRFVALFLVAVAAVVASCSHGEESECSKLVSLLSGENPRVVFDNIADKKCQDAIPIFKDMFDPAQGKYNSEILRVVAALWDPNPGLFKEEAEKFEKKKPLYAEIIRKALGVPETAATAAGMAEEWKMVEVKEDLKRMLVEDTKSSQPQFMAAYAPALRALFTDQMGGVSPDLEDLYIVLLNNSPDYQGIEVNKLAAQALGDLGCKNPEGLKGLIRGLFLTSKSGGTTFKEASRALLQVGPPAVPFLVDILTSRAGDEKVRYMEEFAVKNAISEWQWRHGMKIPMVLAQLRDERSARALLEDMAKPVIEPPSMPDEMKQDWTITQTNRIKFDSWGVMSIASKDILDEALHVMRDRNAEGQARLQLALALAFYFTPEATATLFRVVYEPEAEEEEEEGTAAKVEKKSDLPAPAKESDFVIRFLQPMAYAVDFDQVEQFNDIFVDGFDENFGDQENVDYIRQKMEEADIKVLIQVVRACRKERECYVAVLSGGIGKIAGNDIVYDPEQVKGVDDRETEYLRSMARAKAGLVLSRMTISKENRPEVIKAFMDAYRSLDYDEEVHGDLRQVILLGLERLGRKDPRTVAGLLRDTMEAEGKKEIDIVKIWNQRLESLVFALEKGGAGAAAAPEPESK